MSIVSDIHVSFLCLKRGALMNDKDYKRHLAHDADDPDCLGDISFYLPALADSSSGDPGDFYRRFASGLFSQHKGRSH